MIESTLEIQPSDVAGHYDDLDAYYRKLWGDHLHHGLWHGRESAQVAIEQLIEAVASPLRLDDTESPQVCDVGCGYGGASRHLARHRDWNMTGLTISARQGDYAQRRAAEEGLDERVSILLRNWEQNELPPNFFDGLISIECVSHVVDKRRYFDEVFRVLKPGGRASLTIWLTAEQPSRRAERWLLEPICREGRLPSMGSAADYRELAEASGLRVISHQDLTRRVQKTWSICLRRVIGTLMFTPTGWGFLATAKSRHAVFVATVARIHAAYRLGVMKYGHFVLERPI